MLKLKQQQLQMARRRISSELSELQDNLLEAQQLFESHAPLLNDYTGININEQAMPQKIITDSDNIAGLNVPVYVDTVFAQPNYSLFATPIWIDQVIKSAHHLTRARAMVQIKKREFELVERELLKVLQRVNLFEKVKIPEAENAIRLIRIKLGDEMAAAVGRSKIAKSKLQAISG